MSRCYRVRIETSEISNTDLSKVLDEWDVEVDEINTNKDGRLVASGIAYVSRDQTELANNSIVEAIRAVTPTAYVSTSWTEVDETQTSYQTEPNT